MGQTRSLRTTQSSRQTTANGRGKLQCLHKHSVCTSKIPDGQDQSRPAWRNEALGRSPDPSRAASATTATVGQRRLFIQARLCLVYLSALAKLPPRLAIWLSRHTHTRQQAPSSFHAPVNTAARVKG